VLSVTLLESHWLSWLFAAVGYNLETSFHALTVDPNAIYTIAGIASGKCVQIAG